MDKKMLLSKLNEYIPVKEKLLEEATISVENMSFTNLRDNIVRAGKILEEDFDQNIYVINVPAGVADRNAAVVAIQLNGNCLDLLGYAKEGMISQHTAEKAIEKLIKRVSQYMMQ